MFNIRKFDIALLEAFVALLDERSVSRAARRLRLTQPTVSGMLNRLRDLFGDPLFIRTQHGILPTPRAEALAEPVRELLVNARALVEPAAFDPAHSTATFTFMAHDYLRLLLVPPLARTLMATARTARLAVMPAYVADLGHKLADGTLDLAVTVAADPPATRHVRRLGRDPHLAAVRKGHPLAAMTLDLKTFCALDHAMVSPAGRGFEGPADRALRRKGLARRVLASFPDYPTLMEALFVSDFVALLPETLALRHAAQLRVFRPPLTIPALEIYACWHQRVDRDPEQRWFRDLVFRVISELHAREARQA